jgi:hypothetical protein
MRGCGSPLVIRRSSASDEGRRLAEAYFFSAITPSSRTISSS